MEQNGWGDVKFRKRGELLVALGTMFRVTRVHRTRRLLWGGAGA